MTTSRLGDKEVVQLLIDAGVDLDLQNEVGPICLVTMCHVVDNINDSIIMSGDV